MFVNIFNLFFKIFWFCSLSVLFSYFQFHSLLLWLSLFISCAFFGIYIFFFCQNHEVKAFTSILPTIFNISSFLIYAFNGINSKCFLRTLITTSTHFDKFYFHLFTDVFIFSLRFLLWAMIIYMWGVQYPSSL